MLDVGKKEKLLFFLTWKKSSFARQAKREKVLISIPNKDNVVVVWVAVRENAEKVGQNGWLI